MFEIALFGAGKIGEAITLLLTASGRYRVRVCDVDGERAKAVAALAPQTSAHTLKLGTPSAKDALKGCQAVLSALPYHLNPQVASLAAELGMHYFDLTEDVESTRQVIEISKGKKTAFMPQCGLAPGFISIAAFELTKGFDSLESVKLRVGALPIFPSNTLKYALTWSTDGLINEYGNMCEVVEGGAKKLAFPLEGYERFSLDGDEYECFNTSGGLGTLAAALDGKVQKLDYKTIRYPGHCELVKFLMFDLGFNKDRETLKRVFERSIPTTLQDKCIIFSQATGKQNGLLRQRTYASTVYHQKVNGRTLTAIQVTTASGICAPVDLVLTGKLKHSGGLVRAEEISLGQFLDNEFGRYYRDEKALAGVAA